MHDLSWGYLFLWRCAIDGTLLRQLMSSHPACCGFVAHSTIKKICLSLSKPLYAWYMTGTQLQINNSVWHRTTRTAFSIFFPPPDNKTFIKQDRENIVVLLLPKIVSDHIARAKATRCSWFILYCFDTWTKTVSTELCWFTSDVFICVWQSFNHSKIKIQITTVSQQTHKKVSDMYIASVTCGSKETNAHIK